MGGREGERRGGGDDLVNVALICEYPMNRVAE